MGNARPSRSGRLDDIIAEYLQAAEDGALPTERELIAKYPDHAAQLREFLADKQQMDRFIGVLADREDTPGNAHARTLPPTPGGAVAGPRDDSLLHQSLRYFGDYELLEEIARGGMGVVYRARQVSLNRIVALKMILAGQLAGEADVRRFYAEAEAAAHLDHPGIVPVFEVGQHQGQHYFSMGYVEGQSLAERLADGPLPPKEAAELIEQIGDAVAFAHEQGVVHRDLKPGNVLLDNRGRPRVTDFGLAKKIEADSSLTGTGQILGTPSYMAPEQARGNQAGTDAAVDVYALGAILYCMLTGRPPFQAATPLETMLQVLDSEPTSPRQLNPGLPRDLETICLVCLNKDRHRRYRTARELCAEVRRFLNGEPIVARPVGAAVRSWRWCRRNPVVAGLSAAMVVALLAGTIVSVTFAIIASQNANREATQRQAAQALAESNASLALEEKAARLAAERALRQATAMRLSAQARVVASQNPAEALLVAAEAAETCARVHEPVPRATRQTLLDLLGGLGGRRLPVPSAIRSHAVSQDRNWLATGGDTGMAWLWNLEAPSPFAEPAMAFSGHEGSTIAAFAPDGRRLVSAGGGGLVRVWDLAGTEPAESCMDLRGHGASVSSVAFSPDGDRVVSVGLAKRGRYYVNQSVFVWDLRSRPPARIGFEHPDEVESAFFAADSERLVTVSRSKAVRVWELQGEQAVPVLHWEDDHVSAFSSPLAFSPRKRYVAAKKEESPGFQLWDLTAAVLSAKTFPVSDKEIGLSSLAFGPDDRRMVATANERVWVYNLDDEDPGATRVELRGHTRRIASVTFDAGGQRLITGADDGTARIWDLSQEVPADSAIELTAHGGVQLADLTHTEGTYDYALAFSGNQGRVWSSLSSPEHLQQMNLIGHTDRVRIATSSPLGDALVTVEDRSMRFWRWGAIINPQDNSIWNSSAQGLPSVVLQGHSWVHDCVFTPNGRYLVSFSASDARVWDLRHVDDAGSMFAAQVDSGSVAALSDDGARLIATRGRADPRVAVWDLPAGSNDPVTVLDFSEDTIQAVALSGDGRFAAIGGKRGKVQLHDLSSLDGDEAPRVLQLPRDEGRGFHLQASDWLRFSPTGRKLAAVNAMGGVRLWTLANADPESHVDLPLEEQIPFGPGVTKLIFSPDGRRLAVVEDRKKQVRVWDVEAADPAGSAVDLPGIDVDFAAKSSLVACLGFDGAIRIWDSAGMNPQSPARMIQRRDPFRSLQFSPDGQKLLTIGPRDRAQIWDVTGEPEVVIELRAHSPMDRAMFCNEARRVVAVHHVGGGVSVWDLTLSEPSASSITLPRTLAGGGFEPRVLPCARADAILAVDQSTVRVWELSVPRWLASVRERVGRALTDEEKERHSVPGH